MTGGPWEEVGDGGYRTLQNHASGQEADMTVHLVECLTTDDGATCDLSNYLSGTPVGSLRSRVKVDGIGIRQGVVKSLILLFPVAKRVLLHGAL